MNASMKINILQAFNGDAIHINYKDEKGASKNVVIDSGPSSAYSKKGSKGKAVYGDFFALITELKRKEEFIDLLIVTHIDDDHINGLLKWIKTDLEADKLIGQVWFNSGKLIAKHLNEPENPELEIALTLDENFETSVKQGITFESYITDNGLFLTEIIYAGKELDFGPLHFEFLSPNPQKLSDLLVLWKKEAPDYDTSGGRGDYTKTLKELLETDNFVSDTRCANGSSIAFILSYETKKYLFLGDSHPGVICEQLKKMNYNESIPLPVEFVKISHHGSAANTCPGLLKFIASDHYILSTDGLQHGHPDKSLIARIIAHNPKCTIRFNYPELIDYIFSEQDYQDFPDFSTAGVNDIPMTND